MTSPSVPPLDTGPIRAREQAATEGPWEVDYDGGPMISTPSGYQDPWAQFEVSFGGINPGEAGLILGDHEGASADAEFIAHARTDIPALLTEVSRLSGDLEAERRKTAAAAKQADIWDTLAPGLTSEARYFREGLARQLRDAIASADSSPTPGATT